MGWETNVITQISFNKETYDSIYKVKDDIDFCKKNTGDSKQANGLFHF